MEFVVKDDNHSKVIVLFGPFPRATITIHTKLSGVAAGATIERDEWLDLATAIKDNLGSMVVWQGLALKTEDDVLNAIRTLEADDVDDFKLAVERFREARKKSTIPTTF